MWTCIASQSQARSYLDFNFPRVSLLAAAKFAYSTFVISICSPVGSFREWILTLNMGIECLPTPFMITLWRVSWREGIRCNFLVTSMDIKFLPEAVSAVSLRSTSRREWPAVESVSDDDHQLPVDFDFYSLFFGNFDDVNIRNNCCGVKGRLNSTVAF